jgi:hypothetical protein
VQVRSLIDRSRAVGTAERDRMLSQAASLLRETTALRTRDGTIAVDDSTIAEVLAAQNGANRALAILDAYIAAADRAARSPIDPAAADARLREVLGASQTDVGSGAGIAALLAWIASRLSALLTGLGGVPDLRFVPFVLIGLGLALVAFILATLGRGLKERFRREVVVADRAQARAEDPAAHLHAAESALAGGRAREAIHELYLYVIGSLSARELIRYDPALTDRELLLRAAAIPHADALRDLVALNERAWFGLREPEPNEAQRARSLAARVAE